MSIRNILNDGYEGVMLLEPAKFDAAILGVLERCGEEPKVCYSLDKILKILMEDGMEYEEALEYYEYNVVGAWMGDQTPAFLNTL
jgi:hypothetical protein